MNETMFTGRQLPAAATMLSGPHEAREPEIPHQMDALERNINGLGDIVCQLDSRISVVVRPEPPSNTADKNSPRPVPATVLGGRLQNANDVAVMIRCRLENLLARIEV